MKTLSTLASVVAVFAALFLAGCGKKSESGGASSGSSSAPAAASRAVPSEGRAVEVVANDSMKFNVTEIRVKSGEAIALTLKNAGTMPKFSMGHNWVLVENGVKLADFTNDAGQAVKTDYVPEKYAAKIIAHTKLLGPAESDTILFYAPKQVGRYDFLCTFPGHFQVGMKGVLIVD
jgi:azurin